MAGVARIGGVVIIDTIYQSFFLITLSTLLALMLNVSIILPWVPGLVTLALLLAAAAISIYTFVHTDAAVGWLILEYQKRKHEAKRKRDATAETVAAERAVELEHSALARQALGAPSPLHRASTRTLEAAAASASE